MSEDVRIILNKPFKGGQLLISAQNNTFVRSTKTHTLKDPNSATQLDVVMTALNILFSNEKGSSNLLAKILGTGFERLVDSEGEDPIKSIEGLKTMIENIMKGDTIDNAALISTIKEVNGLIVNEMASSKKLSDVDMKQVEDDLGFKLQTLNREVSSIYEALEDEDTEKPNQLITDESFKNADVAAWNNDSMGQLIGIIEQRLVGIEEEPSDGEKQFVKAMTGHTIDEFIKALNAEVDTQRQAHNERSGNAFIRTEVLRAAMRTLDDISKAINPNRPR